VGGGGVGLNRSRGSRGTKPGGGGVGAVRGAGGGIHTSGERRTAEACGFGLGGSVRVLLARKLTIIKCTISENRTA
jgi:hypothetical protein